MAKVDNWASWTKGDFTLWEDGCEQLLHLPIVDCRNVGGETLIIFKQKKEKFASLIISRQINDKLMQAASSGGGPFGFITNVALFRTLKKGR